MTTAQRRLANAIDPRALSIARKLRGMKRLMISAPRLRRAHAILNKLGYTLRRAGVEKDYVILARAWVLKIAGETTAKLEAEAGDRYARVKHVATTVGLEPGIVAQARGITLAEYATGERTRLSMYRPDFWPPRLWKSLRAAEAWFNSQPNLHDWHGGNVALFGRTFKLIDLTS